MAIALKKCGVIDAKTYYVYFAQAEQQDILHKEVLEETTMRPWASSKTTSFSSVLVLMYF